MKPGRPRVDPKYFDTIDSAASSGVPGIPRLEKFYVSIFNARYLTF